MRRLFVLAHFKEGSLKWIFADALSEASQDVLMQHNVIVVRLLVYSLRWRVVGSLSTILLLFLKRGQVLYLGITCVLSVRNK